MKVGLHVLRRYTQLPDGESAQRELLDDVGVEVKRIEQTEFGPVATVELLANRGDHYCYQGIARELSGRTGAGVIQPPVASLTTGESPWPVDIQTPLCSLYTVTMLVREHQGSLVERVGSDGLHCQEQ